MKHLIYIYLFLAAFTLSAVATEGGFATAAEFGAPRLQLTAAEPKLTTPLRQWHAAGERPFRAQLTGISGPWGKEATVRLRTPTGRTLNIPAKRLSDADLDSIRNYMKEQSFVQLHTYRYGTLDVKLLNVRRHSEEELQLEMLDLSGKVHYMRTNAHPWQEEYARKVQLNDTIVMQEETRQMLLDYMAKNPPLPPVQNAPLPVAESALEAITYAALRDVSVVVLTMGPRGCKADVAFRQYLSQHPEAAGIWAQRYVFLVTYTDCTGNLPPDCCRELAQLGYHHDNKEHAINYMPAGQSQFNQRCESICGTKYTLLNKSLTHTKSAPAPAKTNFRYTRDTLQNMLPQHIDFNRY